MEAIHVNMMAILVAVVANFFLGYLWFTPLFGKAWGKEHGFDMTQKPPAGLLIKGMVFMIIGNFFMAFVLAHNMAAWSFVPGSEALTATQNILNSAIFTWLGFYVPVDIGVVTWENKSWKLFAINTFYHLTMMLLTATILVLMK